MTRLHFSLVLALFVLAVFPSEARSAITEIIDLSNGLNGASQVAVDSNDNVYVTGFHSDATSPNERMSAPSGRASSI